MVCGVSRLGPLFYNRAPASVRGYREAGALGEDNWEASRWKLDQTM